MLFHFWSFPNFPRFPVSLHSFFIVYSISFVACNYIITWNIRCIIYEIYYLNIYTNYLLNKFCLFRQHLFLFIFLLKQLQNIHRKWRSLLLETVFFNYTPYFSIGNINLFTEKWVLFSVNKFKRREKKFSLTTLDGMSKKEVVNI